MKQGKRQYFRLKLSETRERTRYAAIIIILKFMLFIAVFFLIHSKTKLHHNVKIMLRSDIKCFKTLAMI